MLGTCPECGIRRELVSYLRAVDDRTWVTAHICTKCKAYQEAKRVDAERIPEAGDADNQAENELGGG